MARQQSFPPARRRQAILRKTEPAPPARGFTRGVEFERRAEKWLQEHGLELVQRNFRAHRGEIDLIMRDGEKLVFIEVRKRRQDRFGSALASITPTKVSRIRHVAQAFLKKNVKPPDQPPVCRFDVITFDGEPPDQQLRWVRNAF